MSSFSRLLVAFLAGWGINLAAAAPALPTIPNQTFYVTNYGAVGDGIATNTAAIQTAINAAASSALHGGTVEITSGIFLSGPFSLANNINLRLDEGAILRMLPYNQYPGGIASPPNFISGSSLHDVEISGAGAIDGQGLPWWQIAGVNSAANRPNMVSLSACSRVLIQGATFSNSPSPHLVVKGKGGNVTIQGVTISAPSSGDSINPSHNTDAIDLAETNCLIQDCKISVGDDNVAVGSSASISAGILITNCSFGYGHGVSIGSYTSGGVSNLTVINCTFTNTDQGIRIKSDRDRGGVVQHLGYYNLIMSNVQYPILIYGYYTNNTFGSINNLTPALASTAPAFPITGNTPTYRNIIISNVTGTAQSGRMAGLIWGLPEMPITNLTLNKVQLSGSKTFGIYYAQGIQLADSQISVPAGASAVSFYHAQITFTNSAPANTIVTLDGASTNATGNTLLFYNTQASLKNTNALAIKPVLTIESGALTISNHLDLSAAAQLTFALGTNSATLIVRSNLVFNGNVNLNAGLGFTNGAYTLVTYGKALTWGTPTLGTAPEGYLCSFDTNTAGEIKILAIANPIPSLAPVSIAVEAASNPLRLTWPLDHTGWRLQIQTNTFGDGLGTNWNDLPQARQTNRFFVPLDPANGSVFLRLIYP